MKRTMISLLFLALAALPLAAAKKPAEDTAKAVPLTTNLYLVQGLEGGNVAFLVTERGVVVVDSGTAPADGARIVSAVKKVTPQPIRYMILTHYHGDHTLGLQTLPDSVQVIGQNMIVPNMKEKFYGRMQKALETDMPKKIAALQEKAAKLKTEKSKDLPAAEKELKEAQQELAELKRAKPRLPDQSFARSLILYMGSDTIHLIYPEAAHTNCNILVLFPRQKAVHMGDMFFHQSLPYIDFQAGANTANWLAQLNKVLTWDVETVIPGHGPVANKEGLKLQIQYLTWLRSAVAVEMVKGSGLDAVRSAVALAPEYKGWQYQQIFPMNIEAVYRELSAPAKEVLAPKKQPDMAMR